MKAISVAFVVFGLMHMAAGVSAMFGRNFLADGRAYAHTSLKGAIELLLFGAGMAFAGGLVLRDLATRRPKR
jgi:hypothetical protein